MDHQNMIEQLRNGSEDVLRTLYRDYRSEFVQWAVRQYSCKESEAADAFQESIIILYEKVQSGQLQKLTSHIKTYLFGIGKNRLYKQFSKEITLEQASPSVQTDMKEESVEYRLEVSDQAAQLSTLVASLANPCDQLLYFFYYRQFTMESIANRMNYKSAQVAKAQKNRCMNKLREKAEAINLRLT